MTKPVERGAIWTLISVDVFARVSYGLARTPVLPLYAWFLGAGPAMIGFVGAAATITGIVLKLPSGAISDVIGRRPLLLAGLFVFATGPLFYLFLVVGPVSLMGVRFYHGLATAIYSPVAMAAVAALAADRRGEYLSWLSNSKIAGKLLGAFAGGLVLSLAIAGGGSFLDHIRASVDAKTLDPNAFTEHAFQVAYIVVAVLGGLAFLLGLLVLGKVDPPDLERKRTFREVGRKFAAGVREMVSDARVLLASGSEGVQNLTVGIVESFLPIYAVSVAGRSPFEAGLLYGGQILTTILAKPAFGRWSDRKGRKGVILVGMFLCAVPFAAIPWFTGFWPLFALALVFGLGEALVTSTAAAFVGDLCQERSLGAAMGVFGTIKDSGHALGPILGGLLIALFTAAGGGFSPEPFRITFAIVAALLVLYSALFAAAVRSETDEA